MIYFFEGAERLQLMFDSPNKLAAFICMMIPFCVCLIARSAVSLRRGAMSSWTSFALCLVLEGALARTYSRGGFVAFGASMAVLFWCGFRKWSMVACGALGALLLLVPKAAERAVMINPVADLSVWHRLLLWKGACGIAVNAFPFGVGRPVGQVFIAWYQALEKHQPYLTAVSDPLTVAARCGLPVLFLALTVTLAVFLASAAVARRKRLAFPAALSASGMSFLVAGLFSTFHTTPLLIGVFIAIVCGAAIVSFRSGRTHFAGATIGALAVSAMVCLVVGIVGIWTVGSERIRFDYGFPDACDGCRVWVGKKRCQGDVKK